MICSEKGYIQKIDAAKLGYCAMRLGAGREYKGQEIDLSAGIMLEKRVGDRIEKGQSLCTIYANNEVKIKEVQSLLVDAIKIDNKQVPKTNLILGVVDHYGFKAT
ncbi:MAG: pyrimidine-nucleoside phosphorylase [Firmicutes bacterium]|nr:pyrimidine-nucleoside phosphorylase [Bacillota bacterium]